jgi:type IV fimbrial biogenesis protein FimT
LLGGQKGRDVLTSNRAGLGRLIMPERCRGVSLIEMMIGIAIMVLLLFIAMPNFSIWMANARIRTGAESIQDGLRYARAEAVRQNTQVRFQLTAATTDWTVCVPVTPASVDCNGAAALQTHSGIEAVASIAVGGWTTQGNGYGAPSTAGTPNGVTFNTLGGSSNAGDLTRIDVTNPSITPAASMRWLAVNISPSGQVAMCDPSALLAATNPFHCN